MSGSGARRPLELICVGRAAVDLYGEQIGGRLEDMSSFAKYLGGSPANTAVGASRLGLKCRDAHARGRRAQRPLRARDARRRGRRRVAGAHRPAAG